MEMENNEAPENIASFNCEGFIMGLVGFEMTSVETMPIKPLTDHDNYLPLWERSKKNTRSISLPPPKML